MTQVIKKRRIVLASVLKPVDDTRMFEKFGITLADSNEFQVTVIGYPPSGNPAYSGIKFRPLSHFKRFSAGRLLAPWKVYRIINRIKPDLVVINTPELLLAALLSSVFFGRKIIYDVRENYYRNIRFTPTFPKWARLILASMVRLTEHLTKPLVSLYILAEKGYVSELKFARPFIVAENKLPEFLVKRFARTHSSGHHRLLFTGTIAPTTGILEAIRICKELHQIDGNYTLTIAGYCAIPEFLSQIQSEISGSDFIKLIGGDTLVEHTKILSEIGKADVGIIIYSVNQSTESSIPTKLYEYLSLKLPLMIRHNEESHTLVNNLKAGIVLPKNIDFPNLNSQLGNLLQPNQDQSLYWEPEGKKVIDALKLM